MKIAAPLVVLSVLALTACSGGNDDASSSPAVSVAPAESTATASAATSASASPSAQRKENDRGELIKEIGETASLLNEEGTERTMNFKVTSIKPVTCDAPYAEQPNGTALAVSLEIETTANFEGPISVNGAPGQIGFGSYYWNGYADNGTRMNTVDADKLYNCLADTTVLLPDYIGKAEKLNGIVLLDVSTPTGSVAYDPQGNGGWIWNYPSQ